MVGEMQPRPDTYHLAPKIILPTSRPSLSASRQHSSFSEESERIKARRATIRRNRSSLREITPLLSPDNHLAAETDAQGESRRGSGSSAISSILPRTAFDKKTDLVIEEIDRIGFGTYQWALFFVCGSGWLLDLLWAHAFGLAMPAIQHELGFPENQYGYLSTGFSIGMTCGALSWGILLDIVGRRAAFNYTVAISSLFGICTGFASNYSILIALATGVGFGVGGNIPVDTTIFLEFIPRNKRTMLVVMSIFQPIGSILSTLLGWGLIPANSCSSSLKSCNVVATDTPCCMKSSNMGWRYMFYAISIITLLIFGIRFVAFTMLESPAFLLSHHRDAEVVAVLQGVAKHNSTTCKLSLQDLSAQKDDKDDGADSQETQSQQSDARNLIQQQLSKFDISHLQLLFKDRYTARLTIFTWFIYAADFWGFTLAGVFLPKILLQKGATHHRSVSDTYLEYIFIAMSGIPGALVSMWIIQQKISRRLTMAISSAAMAISLFLFATVSTSTGNLVFNCIEYFCQTVFNAILYAWTPEVFEGSVRGSATGIAAFWGRLVSIIAPIIGSQIFAAGSHGGNNVLFVAGGGTLFATACILLLP